LTDPGWVETMNAKLNKEMLMSKYSGKIKSMDFKPQVLGEQVSQILIDAILEGSLKQGDQLIEADLQKHFNVSRSPLREAFRDLEKKGLVEIIPRRGAFVRTVTTKDVKENFPVRAALEGLAARDAYPKMTTKDLKQIRKAYAGMQQAVEKKQYAKYREYHHVFHDTFIKASCNDLLIELLETLRMHRLWYFLSFHYHKEDFKKSLAIHNKILKLFEGAKSDTKELENLVRTHIDEALDFFIDYIQGHENVL
jgi:DNA-binding GntR family transcriptional regulator